MPYRICKTFEVESGHILSQHPGRCRFPHGHTRRVEIVLEADDVDANGMVCDFGALKTCIAPLVDAFDHSICMNTADPMFEALRTAYGDRVMGFTNQDPTSEVLVRYFHDQVRERLDAYRQQPDPRFPVRPGVRLRSVRIWETSSSWAEYSDPA